MLVSVVHMADEVSEVRLVREIDDEVIGKLVRSVRLISDDDD